MIPNILIMVCIGICFIGFLLELVNKYRYKLFRKRIFNDTVLKKVKVHIFGDICKNLTDSYSRFIMKHLMNDNFLQIFKIYYPDCKMNKTRINCVVNKYLYDLDESMHISINNDCVDILTNRFVNQYIMTDNLVSTDDPVFPDNMIDPTDLSNISHKKSFINIVYNYLKYLVFCFKMYRKGYVKHDIGPWLYSNIRLWINNSAIINDTKDCIIIDEMIDPVDCSVDAMYIEIKGFTQYSELFDTITIDLFNQYPKMIDITKQFGALIDQYLKNTKMKIHAKNISTFIIPGLVNYYEEKIEKIIVNNPVYYPYSYTAIFDAMRKIDAKKKYKINLNPNLLMLLNRLTLIDIYFDFVKLEKSMNRLYQNCVDVKLDKKSCENLCIDNDNLTMLMVMHSECAVKNVELNTD